MTSAQGTPRTARNSTSISRRGPFYGFNRPGVQPIEGIIRNWWRQGMMGGVKAHYDCVKAFSETDFTEDLKAIDVPVLVMHGEDDQIVPYRAFRRRCPSSCSRTARSRPIRAFRTACRRPMPTSSTADLLEFIRGETSGAAASAPFQGAEPVPAE